EAIDLLFQAARQFDHGGPLPLPASHMHAGLTVSPSPLTHHAGRPRLGPRPRRPSASTSHAGCPADAARRAASPRLAAGATPRSGRSGAGSACSPASERVAVDVVRTER